MQNIRTLYVEGNSVLHKQNPPLKIILAFLTSFAAAFFQSYLTISIYFLLTIVFILVSRLDVVSYIKRLKTLLYFFVPMTILLLLTSGGEILYTLNTGFIEFYLYQSGFETGILISLRGFCIFSIFYLLLSTTKIIAVLHSMTFLKVPHNIALIFFFTYRYIFRYIDDLNKMKDAITLRGYYSKRGFTRLISKGRIYANLLVRSYEDTDRIYKAMVLRGLLEKSSENIRFTFSLNNYLTILFFMAVVIMTFIFDNSGI